jgi:hypothetical protein
LSEVDYKIRSHKLPGGDFVSAVLNRHVMGLADRGGSSGLVGSRWADLCAIWARELSGKQAHIPAPEAEPFTIDRVARLDDLPRIATIASRKGLQNPDLLFLGSRDGNSVVQAADAKFSVETARSKQVSPEVVEALLGLGALISSLTGALEGEVELVPGVFLSPDYPLTHLMLGGRQGITKATVSEREVIFVPVDAREFFRALPGRPLMDLLAGIDALPVSIDLSLLAGLYYFRLCRAIVGSWLDSVKPLLTHDDRVEVDESAVLLEATERVPGARSAFDLVLAWDADVEAVRARRAHVEQVAGLPIMSRDLRNAIQTITKGKPGSAPSVNQVRRRLGFWFRRELRELVGPMLPSEQDFTDRLRELATAGAQVAQRLPQETVRIILELCDEREHAGSEPEDLAETTDSGASDFVTRAEA